MLREDSHSPVAPAFQVGGSLAGDAISYVRRQADEQLYAAVRRGEFCYVFNARQMGKSSLRVQVMQRLSQAGCRCVAIDLSAIGTQQITAGQWYASLAALIVAQVQLPLRLGDWWRERAALSDVARLGLLLDQVLDHVAQTHPGASLVIFMDEVDSLLGLPFAMDDFFSWVRSCYNRRAEDARYRQLNFVLLGVTTPPALIQDKRLTPFNIGQAIELRGFQPIEAVPLLTLLQQQFDAAQVILQQILYWTGGQPFLTQKLCQLVAATASEGAQGDWSQRLQQLVRRSVIEHWEGQDEPEHLRTIRDRLLHDRDQAPARLRYYQRILQSPQGRWPIDNSEIQRELQLTGLVQLQPDGLQVANPIYEAVFNADWVDQQLARLGAVTGLMPVSMPALDTAAVNPEQSPVPVVGPAPRWRWVVGGGLVGMAVVVAGALWQVQADRSRQMQLMQADLVAAQALIDLADRTPDRSLDRPPDRPEDWRLALFHADRADRASQAFGQPNPVAAQLLQQLVYRYQPNQNRYQAWQSPQRLINAGFQGTPPQLWSIDAAGTIGLGTAVQASSELQLPAALRQVGVQQAVWASQAPMLFVLDRQRQLWCLPVVSTPQGDRRSDRLNDRGRCPAAKFSAPIEQLVSSDDGSTVAIVLANGEGHIWQDTPTGLQRRGGLSQVRQLQFLPQRSEFLVLTRTGQIQRYYPDLVLASTFDPQPMVQAIAPSHNGELIIGVTPQAQLFLWSADGAIVAQFPLPFTDLDRNPVTQLQLNADSSLIALGRRRGPIALFDRQGQSQWVLPTGGDRLDDLRFDASSNQLLSRSGSHVTLWQIARLAASPWRSEICPLLQPYLATAPNLSATERSRCR